MVYFVGAGPGAPDLITLRGAELLKRADLIVYAGSLVNPQLLDLARGDCEVRNSASMTLEQVVEALVSAHRGGRLAVRLHTGDPSLYGAVREQYDALRAAGVPFETVPGVSSFLAAAAALGEEYTLPGVSQTVILTRAGGRTPVPEQEEIALLAAHGATMAIFLSAGMLDKLSGRLVAGGYAGDSPAALVYKASWEDELVIRTTVANLGPEGERAGINRTALVLVGGFLGREYGKSKLYDESFTHMFRRGTEA